MLSSFFKTRKPVHYLICFVIAILVSGFFVYSLQGLSWESFGLSLLLLLSIAILQFIALKNNFSDNHSYALWLFTVWSLVGLFISQDVIGFVAYCFFLLSLRRLLSMRSGSGLLVKVFDASLWITLAALFFSWSALFLISIYIGIIIYAFNHYRNWVAPLLAVATVFWLCFTYDYVMDTNHLNTALNGFDIDYYFKNWELNTLHLTTAIMGVLGSIACLGLLFNLPNTSLSSRSKFSLMGFVALTGLAVALITGYFWFLIPSISVFMARVAHHNNRLILKESILIAPLILLLVLIIQLL